MILRMIIIVCLFVSTNGLAQTLLRDPTRPANKVVLVDETASAGELNNEGGLVTTEDGGGSFPVPKLSAIVVTDDAKYAIINNEVVYEGQQWRNVLLAKIKPYSITLSLNDQIKEITINNNDFIKESDENF